MSFCSRSLYATDSLCFELVVALIFSMVYILAPLFLIRLRFSRQWLCRQLLPARLLGNPGRKCLWFSHEPLINSFSRVISDSLGVGRRLLHA